MFIYTIADVVGVIFWGLVLLFFAGLAAVIASQKLWRKIKRTFSRQRS